LLQRRHDGDCALTDKGPQIFNVVEEEDVLVGSIGRQFRCGGRVVVRLPAERVCGYVVTQVPDFVVDIVDGVEAESDPGQAELRVSPRAPESVGQFEIRRIRLTRGPRISAIAAARCE